MAGPPDAKTTLTGREHTGEPIGSPAVGSPRHTIGADGAIRRDGIDAALIRLEWTRAPTAGAYRLQIHDPTTVRMVLDEVVSDAAAAIDADGIDLGHNLRFRVQARHGGDWSLWQDWRPMPLSAVLESPLTQPDGEADQPPSVLLMFTIDTECPIHRMRHPDLARAPDELIFGDVGTGQKLGIDLHMDLLEHFGHRGCFFVEVLMEHQFGQAALERVLEAILSRGHEVE